MRRSARFIRPAVVAVAVTNVVTKVLRLARARRSVASRAPDEPELAALQPHISWSVHTCSDDAAASGSRRSRRSTTGAKPARSTTVRSSPARVRRTSQPPVARLGAAVLVVSVAVALSIGLFAVTSEGRPLSRADRLRALHKHGATTTAAVPPTTGAPTASDPFTTTGPSTTTSRASTTSTTTVTTTTSPVSTTSTTTATTTTTTTAAPAVTTTTTLTLPPTTTLSPTTTTTGGKGATGCGARFFSCASAWNAPLPSSTTWHDKPALRSGAWFLARDAWSNPVVIASISDPVVAVSVPASWGWPSTTLPLHVPSSAAAAAGADGSLVIVDGGIAYNFWQFVRTSSSTASSAAYAEADVTATGWGTTSPWQAAGIRAAGSSGLGGEIYGDELTTGIHHALAVAGPGGMFCAEAPGGYVAPAISGDGACEGPRLGIPAGTAMPAGLSVPGQSVWLALQTYGGYAVDTAGCCAPIVLNADPNSVPAGDAAALANDLPVIEEYVRMVG